VYLKLYQQRYPRRPPVKVLTFSDVRKNFKAVLDAVVDDAEECVIPRTGGQAVVIVSLDEWNSLKETMHVLGTRDNARRLLDSVDAAERGDLHQHLPPEQDAQQAQDVA
jgi:antitoxin YefM